MFGPILIFPVRVKPGYSAHGYQDLVRPTPVSFKLAWPSSGGAGLDRCGTVSRTRLGTARRACTIWVSPLALYYG